ncbi:MAG: chemotaxis protein CheC [Methanoregulaceae archaeon]
MKLTPIQKDAMQELANIGAAHAATTLSQMLNSQVDMSVPVVNVVDISRVSDCLGDEFAAMVVFELQGEISHGGYVVFHVSKESALRMTNTMLGMTDMDRELNEMDQSALLEVGNIMVSAFLDATAELLGIVMLPSPPALSMDMAHAAFESLIAQLTIEVNEVLLFKTELTCEEHKVAGNLIMLPEAQTLEEIISLLEGLMAPPA